MSALGRELVRRGHAVTVVNIPDIESRARENGLNFYPIGARQFPPGSYFRIREQRGALTGLTALRFTVGLLRQFAEMLCADAPGALRAMRVDCLLIHQHTPAGPTVADYLGIPYVTICDLPLNREPSIPPVVTSWPYRKSRLARLRNEAGYRVLDWVSQPIMKVIAEYRRRWNLPQYQDIDDSYSKLAQVTQLPRCFDYQRAHLPECFHYAGPFLDGQRCCTEFPFGQLDGRPLIYASMGTIVNRIPNCFHTIAEACLDNGCQLLISLGGGSSENISRLPGNPLIVDYAPQLQLLARTSVFITHAGLNSALESLASGVPVVGIPAMLDQPATGERIRYVQAGRIVPIRQLSTVRIREAIIDVMSDDRYRAAAKKIQTEIKTIEGITRAADIIEMVVKTNTPVLNRYDTQWNE